MSRPDLDGIIRSPSAETFLLMVTKGFYDNSYTGLWMYEVIGREWDEMREWAEELKDEINPQTCTWSIGIWEWVYGIKTDETLQLEYRRQRILAKILGTKPVNPEVIRRGVARIIGCDVDITDFAGPYRFALKIHMQEDGDALPYGLVREYIRIVKPSHLAAFLAWVFLVVIDSTQLEQFLHPWVRMHWCIPFWGCDILNGARFLDGSVLLNARRRYDLVLGIKNDIKFYAKEAVNTDRIYINIPSCFNTYEKICGTKVLFRLGDFSFWKCAVLNGIRLLDGSVLLNSRKRYDLVLGINNAIKLSINEDINVDKVYMKITSCFNINESINSLRAVFKLVCSGLWEFINNMPGKYNMPLKVTMPACAGVKQDMDAVSLANGIIKVQAEEKTGAALACKASVNFLQGTSKENALTAGTRHMASAGVSETVGEVTITYRRNLCYLDGSGLLDGSRLVNAFYGKESI